MDNPTAHDALLLKNQILPQVSDVWITTPNSCPCSLTTFCGTMRKGGRRIFIKKVTVCSFSALRFGQPTKQQSCDRQQSLREAARNGSWWRCVTLPLKNKGINIKQPSASFPLVTVNLQINRYRCSWSKAVFLQITSHITNQVDHAPGSTVLCELTRDFHPVLHRA